ncbi:hypothetical protein RIF29_39785 [Crotalaria pallida]|uniref:Uncharacterized protein n=1 Tax=Crotalaria pallida TaxID=3830 RepID=A0AAN9E2N4_CROPI
MVVNQFPQPIRPPNSYDISFINIPSTSYPQNLHNSKASNVPLFEEEEEQEEEEGKGVHTHHSKLVKHIMDKCEKLLPENIRDQINLEEMMQGKEGNREVKSRSNTSSRGLQKQVEEGSSEKLERFKIRTVVAEEVPKEDAKK